MDKYKIIEAKVDPHIHMEIKKYCLLKAKISLKKFASIAVEKYYQELNQNGEMIL